MAGAVNSGGVRSIQKTPPKWASAKRTWSCQVKIHKQHFPRPQTNKNLQLNSISGGIFNKVFSGANPKIEVWRPYHKIENTSRASAYSCGGERCSLCSQCSTFSILERISSLNSLMPFYRLLSSAFQYTFVMSHSSIIMTNPLDININCSVAHPRSKWQNNSEPSDPSIFEGIDQTCTSCGFWIGSVYVPSSRSRCQGGLPLSSYTPMCAVSSHRSGASAPSGAGHGSSWLDQWAEEVPGLLGGPESSTCVHADSYTSLYDLR